MKPASSRRFQSDDRLSPRDFRRLAATLSVKPSRARKTGLVAAREAKKRERVETLWNGKETVNVAKPGDRIVTALGPGLEPLADRKGNLNRYVVKRATFRKLYGATGERSAHGRVFRSKAIVEALYFPRGFDIVAPWGERQRAARGYLLLNGADVYGNHADTFEATYEVLGSRF
jgi:hypothetical protein